MIYDSLYESLSLHEDLRNKLLSFRDGERSYEDLTQLNDYLEIELTKLCHGPIKHGVVVLLEILGAINDEASYDGLKNKFDTDLNFAINKLEEGEER